MLDGATGTLIQRYGLTEADFRGERFRTHPRDVRGDNDLLCLTRPDIVRAVHDAYLAAGADIISTDPFTAAPDDLGTITTAYRTLEAGHGVAEIIPALRLTGTQDVTWTQQQLTALPKQLTRMKLPAATNDLVALQREL